MSIAYLFYVQNPNSSFAKLFNKNIDTTSNPLILKIDNNLTKFQSINDIGECTKHYINVKYIIDNSTYSNNQKEINEQIVFYNSRLYENYLPRYLKLCKQKLNDEDWSLDSLDYIKIECTRLLNEENAEVKSSKYELEKIVESFDLSEEIILFIAAVYLIDTSCTSIDNHFPDYTSAVFTADEYLSKINQSTYFANCSRIRDQLAIINLLILERHISYLEAMILLADYRNYSYNYSFEYRDNVYVEVRKKIDFLSEYKLYNLTDEEIYQYKSELIAKLDSVYYAAVNNYLY
jgi:hypothetical protein